MAEVIGYIVSNYTWIVFGSILILLAIIGKYADQTNFGQGKEEEQIQEKHISLENTRLEDYVNSFSDKKNVPLQGIDEENNDTVEVQEELKNNKQSDLNNKIDKTAQQQGLELNDESDLVYEGNIEKKPESNNKTSVFEDDFTKFDEEFESVLPKKEIITDDLLDDIESLSLDNPKNREDKFIPDLDDVELPKIKKMEIEEDPWKF